MSERDIVERLREDVENIGADYPFDHKAQHLAKSIKLAADEIEALREALEFYANPEHYQPIVRISGTAPIRHVVIDGGELARRVLPEPTP